MGLAARHRPGRAGGDHDHQPAEDAGAGDRVSQEYGDTPGLYNDNNIINMMINIRRDLLLNPAELTKAGPELRF